VKPAAVQPVAPSPSIGTEIVSTTIEEGGGPRLPTTGTIDAHPTASSDTNDVATDPIFAMSGSGTGSSSDSGPALSAPMSQPQARAGAVNSNTNPPAPMPAPQPTSPSANAGTIRPLTMAPTNPGATAALTAAVASAAGAEQGGTAVGRLPHGGHVKGATPLDSSGGGGNGPTAAPYLVYSGDDGAKGSTLNTNPGVTDVVSDGVQMIVGDANDNQISTVSWSINTTSVYASQTVNYRTGFTNTPFNPPQNAAPNPINFYWGEQPGSYTITANVTYVDNSPPGAQVQMNVTVKQPTGNISNISLGTPNLNSSGYPVTLSSADPSSTQPDGIDYTASVVPTLLKQLNLTGNFEFAVIQTISPLSVVLSGINTLQNLEVYNMSVSNPAGGPQTQPRPVVDDAYYDTNNNNQLTFAGTFYRNNGVTINENTPPANATMAEDDTPMVNNALIAGLSNEIMTYQATFKVTLMFGSYHDIWVPLGYFTWTVNMGAGEDSAGTWSNASQPSDNTSYTSSTAYPNWIESNYYLWSTYGQFVQMS
jgi:hypothetical protein